MLHSTIHRYDCFFLCLVSLLASIGCNNHVMAAISGIHHDDALHFDSGVLNGRGIDPAVAELFGHAPRFLPGENTVTLNVNGYARGRVRVRFNIAGMLCADAAFLKTAGLVSPPGYDANLACFDLRQGWPNAGINMEPGENRLSLVVPPEAIRSVEREDDNWQHGGIAGMVNYSAQYMSSSGGAGGTNFSQIGSETGFNAGDWIVRSRQTFTRFNSRDRINHQAAYAQRSFFGAKKVLQAGQVSLSNSIFGTGQVRGLQVFPDSALASGQSGAGLVEGIAQSQSVVEVHQSGVLVYSTAVPAGPFTLQGFSLLNTRNDLDVTLTGTNGEVQRFVVPAATLLARAPLVSPGFSFGAGRLEQQNGKSPFLATAATGWQLTPFSSLNAGVLGSGLYRASAMSLDTSFFDSIHLSMQGTLAHDTEQSNKGALLSVQLSQSIGERLSVSANGRQQTSGYRELSDVLENGTYRLTEYDRARNQWGGGVNWSATSLGSFSLSWAHSTTFRGSKTDYIRGGFSRQIKRASLSASLERNTGVLSGKVDDRLYLSLSAPLGGSKNVTSYLNNGRRSARTGVRYSDYGRPELGWSVSSDRDLQNHQTAVNGNLSALTPASELSATISHDTSHYTSWMTSASGAVVLHGSGLTLSPYHVSDTFGIARVGEESGVKLDTPAGPVWTDWRGYAVIPKLNAYRRSAVQVDTRSLERNVDIGNALLESETARGCINRVDFDVQRTRRVLIDAAMADGGELPRGASVLTRTGELVTVVGEDGTVFLPDASPGLVLDVLNAGRKVCSLHIELPEKHDGAGLYENTKAICR